MEKIKEKIVLIGGGGHCRSVIDVIEQENRFEIIGVIDDDLEKQGKKILNYKIIGTTENLEDIFKICKNAMVTIGQIKSSKIRVEKYNLLKKIGFNLPVIISPFAYVSKHSKIEEGTIIMHNVLVNANAKIGKNCIINTKSLIEHDAIIGDNCHISTGAIINGGVKVGNNTFIGSNATIKQYIEISENSFIKAGSIVK
jgi:sugar O-acyltransferase (sialic acid O-acetyltransferase NeuD family)